MKEIVKNYYNILLRLSGIKKASYYAAVFIISIMCVICLSGICQLLEGMLPIIVSMAFRFPFYVITFILIFFLNTKAATQTKVIYKENDKKVNATSVVLTLLITALIYSYILFTQYAKAEIIN